LPTPGPPAENTAVAQREQASPGSGAELVLADRKTQVEHAYAQAFPQLRTARARQLSGSGYSAGAEAGRRADLGQPRVTPTR
jgi:hypothetical protein